MKNKLIHLILMTCGLLTSANAQTSPDLKYGMIVHWGLLTFTGDTYLGGKTKDYGWIPAERFAPTGQDAGQWAKLAKDGGMTFAIMVVKHEDGFCLWPSTESDYTIAQSPCKMDLVGNFIAACQAEGIEPGLFYSLVDSHNEGAFHWKGPVGPPFFNLVKRQIVELLTRYPALRILLIDEAQKLSPEQFQEFMEAAKQANPNCVIIADQNPPKGNYYGYSTVPKNWFWHTNEPLTPTQRILDNYYKAQTNQLPFVLNVGPDQSGHIADNQIAVVKQVKDLIANGITRVAPDAPVAKPDATTRLKQIKSLYDQGLINKDDYDKKVKEIIDSM
jgi:alpha-L-fucosidase